MLYFIKKYIKQNKLNIRYLISHTWLQNIKTYSRVTNPNNVEKLISNEDELGNTLFGQFIKVGGELNVEVYNYLIKHARPMYPPIYLKMSLKDLFKKYKIGEDLYDSLSNNKLIPVI